MLLRTEQGKEAMQLLVSEWEKEMQNIVIRSNKINKTEHICVLSQQQVFDLCVKAVMEQKGLNQGANVSADLHYQEEGRGGLGSITRSVRVVITEQH